MNLRILLISNMFPSEMDPLFGVFVKNSKIELEKQGVMFFREILIRGKSKGILKKILNYFLHYMRAIWASFSRDYNLTYVHFLSHHIPVLLFLLAIKRAPVVVNMHGSDIIGLLKHPPLKRLGAFVMKRLDLLIVPTSFYQKLLICKFPGLQEDRIFISPSGGIDRGLFQPLEKLRIKTPGVRLGFVSRLTEKKGWKVFLDALHLLREAGIPFQGIIAGKGADEEAVQEYINHLRLGGSIEYLGFVPQKELPLVYNRLDLYVFPTLIETESLGLTGLEAMSCGLPVVASNIAGPATYIRESYNGYLIPANDPKALVSKIIEFLSLSPKRRQILSDNAQKTALAYDKVQVAFQLRNRLLQLCASK